MQWKEPYAKEYLEESFNDDMIIISNNPIHDNVRYYYLTPTQLEELNTKWRIVVNINQRIDLLPNKDTNG